MLNVPGSVMLMRAGVLGRIGLDDLAALGQLEQRVQPDEDLLRGSRRQVRGEDRREAFTTEGVDAFRRNLLADLGLLAASPQNDDPAARDGVQRRVCAEVRKQERRTVLRASWRVLAFRRFPSSK